MLLGLHIRLIQLFSLCRPCA
ncbi:hypothetical protein Goari_004472 [Gossypium aridum]|uniref:Uncharacterized protein n=1 Tax=Gossypium aridum TaxID=34290 RepID=A0A7J8Y3I8_GOSAI|nr:hypothetical protein [Gossypium aridum]